ncbi:major facilitator superfamily domain-containing protein [Phascolomyces articulosus]|uniref:Major facilitator superfamily domain-containing protein n=1 Tax=Phascolomyces articulosus TaxID=60185 RepID=A0AAD5PDM5_9FUNG|nr:major facilitator superfamily domain-containing protein [Phascolomyces articulosus]
MDPIKDNPPSTIEEKKDVSHQLPVDVYGVTGSKAAEKDDDIDDSSIQEDEKQLVRKLDIRIMILLCFCEGVSRWDGSNALPSAKLMGIMEDLNVSEAQYRWCLTGPFLAFLILSVPINLVLRKSRASLLLGTLVTVWGAIALITPAVKNFVGLLITQIITGACAAANDPVQVYYATLWYRRYETAQRLGWFSIGGGIASSVRGLILYAATQIPNTTTIKTWQWMFIILGLPSFICGVLCILILPDKPETAKFINNEEKELAINRLSKEQAYTASQYSWSWKQVISVLLDWKLYCFTLLFLTDNIVAGGTRLNLPSIIDGMGYWTEQQSVALAVPPYALGCIMIYPVSWLSDKFKQRVYFMVVVYLITAASILLLMFVPEEIVGLRYFAVCAFRALTLLFSPIRNSWASGAFSGLTRRAVALAIFFMGSAAGNAIAGQAYFDPPNYRMGYTVALCSLAVSILLSLSLRVVFSRENKRRNQIMQDHRKREHQITKYGGPDLVGDRHPDYRYSL